MYPPIDPPAKSAQAQQQNERAYQRIRSAIVECRLSPGMEISQSYLVEHLGLTKASIREAMSRLSQEGLTQTMPRRGYIVAPLTLRDIEELHTMRMALEPLAARLAAGRIDAAKLSALNEHCKVGYQVGNRKSEIAFLHANRRFHVSIAQASGNARLARAVAGLQDEAMRMLLLGLRLGDQNIQWQHGHEEIIDALARGDADAAEAIQKRQLEYGNRLVVTAFMASPAVTGQNLVGTPRATRLSRTYPSPV